MRTSTDIELELGWLYRAGDADPAQVEALQAERETLLAQEAERRRTLGMNATPGATPAQGE